MCFAATEQIQKFKLDGATVEIFFAYITADGFKHDHRLHVALILKNIIKKVYGVSNLS